MMKLSCHVIIAILFMCLVQTQGCPSRKICRKKQAQKLRSLQTNDIVVQATYFGKSEGTYRFLTEKTWGRHNGNVRPQDMVSIDTTGFKYKDCFDKLKVNKAYVLILKKRDNTFAAIAPPMMATKMGNNHQKLLWKKLCTTLQDGKTCRMRLSIDPYQMLYIGGIELITCGVESTAPIAEMTWLKDGKSLDKEIYRAAGVYLIREGKNAYIVIKKANLMHNGDYECIVRSEDGQEERALTRIEVRGPGEAKKLTCDAKDHDWCLNGGTCQQRGERKYCRCADGFEGPRCQDVKFELSATHDHETLKEMESQVSQLTTTIVLVAVAFVCVLLFGSIYVFQLRRKLYPNKDNYDAVDQQENGTSTNGNLSGGTEMTTLGLSATDHPESRRPSKTTLHVSRHSSVKSSRSDHLTPSTATSSRHNSTESDTSSRRSRLYAKS